MILKLVLKSLIVGLLALSPLSSYAIKLIVIDARSAQLKAGASIDSATAVALKEGERATLVAPDGKSVTLKGPFSGPAMAESSTAADPKAALAALVNTRDARTSSVGVIRAGTDAAKLPEPWLIDMSRPGTRCLLEGQTPIWWRPETDHEDKFTVFPAKKDKTFPKLLVLKVLTPFLFAEIIRSTASPSL
jgi:hypothetical protein